MTRPAKVPTLAQTIARMKREILTDQFVGRFKARGHRTGKITGFSDLHDYVDANEYGGFCDDEVADALIEHFGGRGLLDESLPDAYLDFMNAAQSAIDAWIKAGGLKVKP